MPIDVGSGRTVQKLAAGSSHTCALLDDGSVKCWGGGSIGDEADTMGDFLPPVDLGTGRSATDIVAGGGYSCALQHRELSKRDGG